MCSCKDALFYYSLNVHKTNMCSEATLVNTSMRMISV